MKMKLSHFLTLIVFGTAVWTAASEDCSSSVSPALSRNKRGITDFFRRLVGGRRKNPTYHHQHQSASPFGHSGSSSNVAGGQDFLYGQSSNQYPMYQAGNVGLSQQASEYVFPGISSSQAGAFSFGNYGSPNGNNAQQQGQQPFYYSQAGQQDNSGYVNQGEQQQYQQGGEQQLQHQHQPGQQYHLQQQQHHSGNYHPQQAQQQQHFQHPDQQQQQQYHQQFQQQQQQYHPHGAGQFQSEESTNQAAISYAEAPSSSSSSSAVQQTGGHSAVTADQDGIASSSNNAAFSLQAPQHLMTAAQSHAVAAYLNSNAGQLQQQQQQQQQNGPGFAASYNRPQYAPYPEAASSRPYGSNPGTLDVHQVLDQFIRSAGLSPQGDHESVKGDQHYADGSDLKPALSVKKLISYPFYFSSSGDKPTSYGQSIRRHSQDETIFKSALNQNLLASQKMEQPSANAMIESKMEPSSPSTSSSSYSQQSVSPSDEESQFIAKHAQALQEFLSKPSAQASSAAGNTAHYYSPLGESSSAKDNKVTSSSSSSASSSSANGQTKV